MKIRYNLLRLTVIGAFITALAALYFIIDARTTGFFPSCPFHRLTGLFCPGCGSQRAISALLHLNFVQALHYNILLIASLPVLLYAAYVNVISAIRNTACRQPLLYSPVFVKIYLVVTVLFFVFRNIPLYPFTELAP